jgi:hypothetical protein
MTKDGDGQPDVVVEATLLEAVRVSALRCCCSYATLLVTPDYLVMNIINTGRSALVQSLDAVFFEPVGGLRKGLANLRSLDISVYFPRLLFESDTQQLS